MTLIMTKQERESFLAVTRIGVLSISEPGRGPLSVPIWYSYTAGGDLSIVTLEYSHKARHLDIGTRISLCVHQDALPYRYVSVEGGVTAIEPADLEKDIRSVSQRYLGRESGNQHAERMKEEIAILVRMHPERWYSVDFSKLN
jgi:PPOX class probable F420-dependent enzyme